MKHVNKPESRWSPASIATSMTIVLTGKTEVIEWGFVACLIEHMALYSCHLEKFLGRRYISKSLSNSFLSFQNIQNGWEKPIQLTGDKMSYTTSFIKAEGDGNSVPPPDYCGSSAFEPTVATHDQDAYFSRCRWYGEHFFHSSLAMAIFRNAAQHLAGDDLKVGGQY